MAITFIDRCRVEGKREDTAAAGPVDQVASAAHVGASAAPE
jgi:hypothetical protein